MFEGENINRSQSLLCFIFILILTVAGCQKKDVLLENVNSSAEIEDDPDKDTISVVSVTITPTSGTAQFVWEASAPCLMQIDYGTNTEYGDVVTNDIIASTNTLTLTSLQENATYYYRMTPVDVDGNLGTYNADSFLTQLSAGNTISVQPTLATIHFGESEIFSGTVTDAQGYTHNSDIAWYLFDALDMGSLNYLPDGEVIFTAGTTAGTVELTAIYSPYHIYPTAINRSAADITSSEIATITIIP